MSKFTPIDESEYKARNVLSAGWYPATITECMERLSNNGNLMFESKIQVFKDDGSFRVITAHIMADGKAAFQLRSAAEAFGVLDEYKAGSLGEDDLKGKSGFVKVAVDVDASGVYPDKNKITDFRKSLPGTVKAADLPKAQPAKSKKQAEEDFGDSVPF